MLEAEGLRRSRSRRRSCASSSTINSSSNMTNPTTSQNHYSRLARSGSLFRSLCTQPSCLQLMQAEAGEARPAGSCRPLQEDGPLGANPRYSRQDSIQLEDQITRCQPIPGTTNIFCKDDVTLKSDPRFGAVLERTCAKFPYAYHDHAGHACFCTMRRLDPDSQV